MITKDEFLNSGWKIFHTNQDKGIFSFTNEYILVNEEFGVEVSLHFHSLRLAKTANKVLKNIIVAFNEIKDNNNNNNNIHIVNNDDWETKDYWKNNKFKHISFVKEIKKLNNHNNGININ